MAENVLTGGRARFFLNDQPMGWASNVSVTEDIALEPVMVLDQFVPAEHATTAYTVQLQAQIFKVPKSDLVSVGLWPQAANRPDSNKLNLLNFPEMTASMYDETSDSEVMKLFRVKCRSRTIQVTARGLVSTNATFVAIYFGDEGTSDV